MTTLTQFFTRSLVAALGLGLLAACSETDNAGTPVLMKFAPEIAGQDFRCQGEYTGMGTGPSQSYRATDFRWYLSQFSLVDDSGNRTRLDLVPDEQGLVYQDADHAVALLGEIAGCDVPEDSRLQKLELQGSAPAGDYAQLCFTLGVPFALNHTDVTASSTPSPLNLPAMNWFWRGGRKFLKIDGVAELQADGSGTAYNFHLGSTGCSNAGGTDGAQGEGRAAAPDQACSQPNTPEYCLDFSAIQAGRSITVDPARLVVETDMSTNTQGTPPGCMGFINDPECSKVMPRHGLDYPLNGNIIPRMEPVLFALEPTQ